VICIPARNEAAAFPRLFAALDHLEVERGREVSVCLLLDGCTDESAALAEAYDNGASRRVRIEHASGSEPNAGRARHRAMAMGLDVLADTDGILLTTDADSTPTRSWLSAMSAGLEQADVVFGKVARCGGPPHRLQDRIESYYESLHMLRRRIDPVPWEAIVTHHQTAGANMGVWASAYRLLGGFAAIEHGEDARLADDASRAGLRVRRDAECLVQTSDRRNGRAAGGMADTLRVLDAGDAGSVSVAHPEDVAWQYRMHSLARAAHAENRLDLIGAALGFSHDRVIGVARDCPNAEAFAMRIVPEPPAGMRTVQLSVAEEEIGDLLRGRVAA
jgi:hypothetical protein